MEHAHEQEEWPQTGQKTAFRKRLPHVTHWLDSVVRGFFMTGLPFPSGRGPSAVDGTPPLAGLRFDPPSRSSDHRSLPLGFHFNIPIRCGHVAIRRAAFRARDIPENRRTKWFRRSSTGRRSNGFCS